MASHILSGIRTAIIAQEGHEALRLVLNMPTVYPAGATLSADMIWRNRPQFLLVMSKKYSQEDLAKAVIETDRSAVDALVARAERDICAINVDTLDAESLELLQANTRKYFG